MIDLIIPTYKNKQGLRTTLNSIPNEALSSMTITVIDDASDISYHDISEDFPFIRFFSLTKNSGPGVVRQYGIEHTCEPYIMFIDTGDYFLDTFNKIFDIINENKDIDIFKWRFYLKEIDKVKISKDNNNNLHGKIYKRAFIEKYNICFSEKGSYGNEDIGFNQLCRLISLQYNKDKINYIQFEDIIMVYDKRDMTSITRKGERAFIHKEQNLALAYNAIHVCKHAAKNGVSAAILEDYAANIMGSEYYYFIRTITERPEFAQEAWEGARYFYLNYYKNMPENKSLSNITYTRIIKQLKEQNKNIKLNFPINILRFMNELNNNEIVPQYYLTSN